MIHTKPYHAISHPWMLSFGRPLLIEFHTRMAMAFKGNPADLDDRIDAALDAMTDVLVNIIVNMYPATSGIDGAPGAPINFQAAADYAQFLADKVKSALDEPPTILGQDTINVVIPDPKVN